jgi:hypothetical protein
MRTKIVHPVSSVANPARNTEASVVDLDGELSEGASGEVGEKPPLLARTKRDKKPVIAALIRKRSDHLRREEVEFVPDPGR